MLSAALGETLLVRSLDAKEPLAIPWLFAALPEASAASLDGAGALSASDIAARLGVFVEDAE